MLTDDPTAASTNDHPTDVEPTAEGRTTLSGSAECRRCASPTEPSDLRCAICGLPTPAAERPVHDAPLVEILRCDGCGAAVSYDAGAREPKCGFCGAVMHVEAPEDPIEEARAYLPLLVDADTAQRGLRQWLSGLGFFRPADLHSAATVASLRPLWWVGWVFDAELVVSWCADSEVGSRRASWAPHAGQNQLTLRGVLVPASRGLSDAECRAIADGYNLAAAGPPPTPPPGALIERFDVQRSAARQAIAEALGRVAREHANEWVPGRRRRKLAVAVLPTKLVSDRLAFPAYVLAYRYKNKLYRAVINGNDPTVITGTAPYSLAKILLVVAGSLVALTLLVILLQALAR